MVNPRYSAVVIGASAGALEALSVILPALPKNFALAIMVVVHMPPDKHSMLAELLQSRCALSIREAQDKEQVQPGVVYVAPPDYHLMVEPDRRLSLSSDEPVMYSRPSIDVLFETAAEAYEDELIGVVLTGANHDGAAGLRKIVEYGGLPLVQSPQNAQARAMPEAALAACKQAQQMTLEEIAQFLKVTGEIV